jgi:hypothetical protein
MNKQSNVQKTTLITLVFSLFLIGISVIFVENGKIFKDDSCLGNF